MKINTLINQIQIVDNGLKSEANKSVNQLLTIRNCLIGYYIVQYEQKGEDRAKYGERLLQTLSEKLDIKGMSYRNLNLFRKFFLTFPEIMQLLTAQSSEFILPIMQSVTAVFKNPRQSVNDKDVVSEQKSSIRLDIIEQDNKLSVDFSEERILLAYKMIQSLSFTHLVLLLSLDDELKRAFYIIESIKGVWSVKELKRQINTLLFERSGLSKKPELLIEKINKNLNSEITSTLVKDIYTFEFLGLPEKYAVEETELESALLDNIREFILELGDGFCLEARQKRILIGQKYYFIDLVFYHRILRCHVLIDLKVNEFDHVNAGQLNTYINYYKKEVKQEYDNDPVGILMVTNKEDALVEFATAGMDKNLFVSKYMLKLPSKEKLEQLIRNEIKNI